MCLVSASRRRGILPPPGVYFDNTAYFYKADISGGRTTRLGGNIVAEVKVDMWADFITGLWVTPIEILGGNLAFGVTAPFGEPGVRAGVLLNGPIINRLLGRPSRSAHATGTSTSAIRS